MTNVEFGNSINNLNSLKELHSVLSKIEKLKSLEIWFKKEGTSSICVLKEETAAFIVYIDDEKDKTFSSRNLKGEKNKFIDFKLNNGQIDEYPENWVVSFEKAKLVIIDYFEGNDILNTISWNED